MENTAIVQTKDDAQHKTASQQLVARADQLAIKTDLEQNQAAEIGKDLKRWIAEAEAFFEPEISQAYALHKSLCEKRRKVVEPVKDALSRLGARLGVYQDDQRRKKAEEEEAARAAAAAAEKKKQDDLLERAAAAEKKGDDDKAADLLQKAEDVYVAPKPVAPVSRPTGTVLRYTAEVAILDKRQVPHQYLVVDEAALKRDYQRSNFTLAVPGVRFTKKPVSGFRA